MQDVATRISSMETGVMISSQQLGNCGRHCSLTEKDANGCCKVFGEVNEHFKTLFKKLFWGGTAELQLTNADDPLEAGLEILVSPPENAFNRYHYYRVENRP